MKKNQIQSHKICNNCDSSKKMEEFFSSRSIFHKDGKYTVCKDCCLSFINENPDELIPFLAQINMPFLQSVWDTVGGEVGIYVRQLQMKQNREKTFKDSDNSVVSNVIPKSNTETSEIDVDPKLRLFWGNGYDAKDIPYINYQYEELIAGYECDTPIQKTLFKNIAVTQFKAENAKSTDEFNKLMVTISKLMQDANVKPVQSKGGTDDSIHCYGLWIKKLEEEEPVPEAEGEFKDPDKIGRYIDKWFIKHFARMLGIEGKNGDDQENQGDLN